MTGLDPTAIRICLTMHRKQRTPWEQAWPRATNHRKKLSTEENQMLAFMEKHFQAAYLGLAGKTGRCRVEGSGPSGPAALPVSTVYRTSGGCQSGAGCERTATHGRFRATFCESHARELARIGGRFDLEISKADPRNGGNKSLYTHKAA